MNLLSMNVRETFASIPVTRGTTVAFEVFELLTSFSSLYDVMGTQEEYESKYGEVDDFEMQQLDVVEEVQLNVSYSEFESFTKIMASGTNVAHRRAEAALYYLNQMLPVLKDISDAYIISTKEAEFLRNNSAQLLAELAYFSFVQYQMKELEDGVGIDIALHNYLDENGKTAGWALELINGILEVHKPSLTIFEEYPELEDDFYFAAGAYIKDFETLSDKLTLETVRSVINGDGDIEKLLAGLEE